MQQYNFKSHLLKSKVLACYTLQPDSSCENEFKISKHNCNTEASICVILN